MPSDLVILGVQYSPATCHKFLNRLKCFWLGYVMLISLVWLNSHCEKPLWFSVLKSKSWMITGNYLMLVKLRLNNWSLGRKRLQQPVCKIVNSFIMCIKLLREVRIDQDKLTVITIILVLPSQRAVISTRFTSCETSHFSSLKKTPEQIEEIIKCIITVIILPKRFWFHYSSK